MEPVSANIAFGQLHIILHDGVESFDINDLVTETVSAPSAVIPSASDSVSKWESQINDMTPGTVDVPHDESRELDLHFAQPV